MTLGSTQPLVKMSTRNIPEGKDGRCVRLTTSAPSRAECHEIWEPKSPGTLWATPGLLRGAFTFYFLLAQCAGVIYYLTCLFLHPQTFPSLLDPGTSVTDFFKQTWSLCSGFVFESRMLMCSDIKYTCIAVYIYVWGLYILSCNRKNLNLIGLLYLCHSVYSLTHLRHSYITIRHQCCILCWQKSVSCVISHHVKRVATSRRCT
jgi:hypothetical protein